MGNRTGGPQRAKLRADLPRDVRVLTAERYRLNRLGIDRLEEHDRERRAQLNSWYSGSHLPLTAAMERARELLDKGTYDRAKTMLEERSRTVSEDRPRRRPAAGS